MKCKNIECSNDTIGKRVYCSLSCRNYYVNKYIRDYTKNSDAVNKSYIEKYIPNKCKLCNDDIPCDNRVSEYCSKDCSKQTINTNRKGSKYNLTEEGLKNLRISSCINFRNGEGMEDILDTSIYTNNCCDYCSVKFYNKRKKKFCSDECRKNKRRIYMDSFKLYKLDTHFKFNLKDFSEEFDFSLVEKYGWYSPSNKKNNLGGVSRDHMLSVHEGFELGIDPKLLSHPANCKLMIHNDNVSKNKTSSINLIQLLKRIEIFDKKYKI